MKKLYVIEGVEKQNTEHENHVIYLSSKDRVEVLDDLKSGDVFGLKEDVDALKSNLREEWMNLIAPLRTTSGRSNFLLISVLSIIMFKLNEPYNRGWRLFVVKNIALNTPDPVPGISYSFRYFSKGFALMFCRFIYFLPLLIIVFLSSGNLLNIAEDLAFYVWDNITNADQLAFVDFFVMKVLPQFGIEVVIHLITLSIYVILIWPIYRIIMIKYALEQVSFLGFFSFKEIKSAISIFKKNASLVYGVFAFSLSVDVIISICAQFISIVTFGLFFWLMPIYYIFFRHWIKGYAYGRLGRELLDRGSLYSPYNNYLPYNNNELV